MLNGVYAGLGQSTGSLLGGKMCSVFGIAGTFKISGFMTLIVLLLYGAANALLMH